MGPAGLPHAQCLRVGELSLEAQQDPAVAEEQLEAVLPQPEQVLVEAGQHEAQQLPQVHLQTGQRRVTVHTQRLGNTGLSSRTNCTFNSSAATYYVLFPNISTR